MTGEGQRGLGLDDRKRGAQLVRCVGGEFELALAGPFDRQGHPAPDRHRTQEDDDEQGEADADLGHDQRRLGLRHAVHGLADDDVVVTADCTLDPNVDSADGHRLRADDVVVGGR